MISPGEHERCDGCKVVGFTVIGLGRLDEGAVVGGTDLGFIVVGRNVGTTVGRADGLAVGLSVGSCVGQSKLLVAVLRNAVRDTPGSPAERPRTHKTRPQNAKALSPMVATVVGIFSRRASEQL